MNFSKVSSKNQVVVPKEVREALGIQDGDQIQWVIRQQGEVVVRKVEIQTVIYDFFQMMAEEAEKQGLTEDELLDELKKVREERIYVKARE